MKYLGIEIDQHLKWDRHMIYISKKLLVILYKFKYLKENIKNVEDLNILYNALVQPQLSYGVIGWGGVLDSHGRKIDILQKHFLKIIHSKPQTYSSKQLYELAKVPDVIQMYAMKIFINIFERKINIKKKNHQYRTRAGEKNFERPRSMKRIGQRCCAYIAPRLLPLLPEEVINSGNKITFKRELIKWIRNFDRTRLHKIMNQK